MDVIERVRRALAGRSDVRLAVLFGSTARGTASADSDVDLAVEAPGVDPLELAASVSLAVGREVDVVDLDAAGVPLLDAIVREGVVVHEAKRGAAGAWRSRALTSLELDRPWYDRMNEAYLKRLATGGVDGG